MSPHDPDRESRLADALAAYIDLAAQQETVELDRFCRQYPDLSAELRDQILTLNAFDPVEEDSVPETLSGYRVIRQIGAGGMGRVFLASDEGLGRRVAIKTLQARWAGNHQLSERFMQEARAMAQLNHPAIVRIYALGPAAEIPHFVMEWIDGSPLVQAARPLTTNQKAELLHKVVLAVDFLHRNHFVHRDLKPANILVDSNLEPKLLDFGLVLEMEDHSRRLTLSGVVVGTPDYFSPEQAQGSAQVDARSDIFALGAILYEVLTGTLPFPAPGIEDQIRAICENDPIPPRRIDRSIPGELQNICMKALEKNPDQRYATARDMAADLERFLSGETVLAAPSSYTRVMRSTVEQHLRDLEGWMHDRLIAESEFDSLRRGYDRLIDREDAWILETRRLTLSQVSLYLGAWVLIVGAALLVLFRYPGLRGAAAIIASAAAILPTVWVGIRYWNQQRYRIAVAFLLAFCVLLPVGLLVAMGETGILSQFTRGRQDLELFSKLSSFRMTTNYQIFAALLLSLPACYWLRRFTVASVFSLAFSVFTALLCLTSLLCSGMLEWLDKDPGRVYFHLIPFAVLFFIAARALESLRLTGDSRYFYPLSVAFTFVALSGVAAFHEPYAQWLERAAPWTRGRVEYLFLINAALYLILQTILERFHSTQLRGVAKAFRFVLPGHVMGSLLLLGIAASDLWNKTPADLSLRFEARLFEVLLPITACAFVFGSVPKQMKNFFVSGLLFLAVGVVRLQQDLLRDRALWPVALLLAGLTLMLAAASYLRLRLTLGRFFRAWK